MVQLPARGFETVLFARPIRIGAEDYRIVATVATTTARRVRLREKKKRADGCKRDERDDGFAVGGIVPD